MFLSGASSSGRCNRAALSRVEDHVRHVIAAGLALAFVLLGGCARDAEPEVEVPAVWRAQIDQALAGPDLSEIEREILEDYWVTDAELARVHEPIPGCMAEHGFKTEMQPTQIEVWADTDVWGGRDLDDPEVEAALTVAEGACMNHLMYVESFYSDMRSNPEGWDYREALVRCVERLGLVEARGMSGAELEAATLEDDTFITECRGDPWSVAQGSPPPEGEQEHAAVEVEVEP